MYRPGLVISSSRGLHLYNNKLSTQTSLLLKSQRFITNVSYVTHLKRLSRAQYLRVEGLIQKKPKLKDVRGMEGNDTVNEIVDENAVPSRSIFTHLRTLWNIFAPLKLRLIERKVMKGSIPRQVPHTPQGRLIEAERAALASDLGDVNAEPIAPLPEVVLSNSGFPPFVGRFDIERTLYPLYERGWQIRWRKGKDPKSPHTSVCMLVGFFQFPDASSVFSFLRDVEIISDKEGHHPSSISVELDAQPCEVLLRTFTVEAKRPRWTFTTGISLPPVLPAITLRDLRLAVILESVYSDLYTPGGRDAVREVKPCEPMYRPSWESFNKHLQEVRKMPSLRLAEKEAKKIKESIVNSADDEAKAQSEKDIFARIEQEVNIYHHEMEQVWKAEKVAAARLKTAQLQETEYLKEMITRREAVRLQIPVPSEPELEPESSGPRKSWDERMKEAEKVEEMKKEKIRPFLNAVAKLKALRALFERNNEPKNAKDNEKSG